MVIAKTTKAMNGELPASDQQCEVISEHIERLVRKGFFAAQGNARNWRFSEVGRVKDEL